MSTYASTLRINDQISRPLQGIVRAMHMTLNVMEQLNSATSRDMQMSQTIAQARGEITSANRAIQNMTQSIRQTNGDINNNTNRQREFNSEVQNSNREVQMMAQNVRQTNGGLVNSANNQRQFNNEVQRTAQSINQTNSGINNISNNQSQLSNRINDTTNNQRRFNSEVTSASREFQRTTQSINQTNNSINNNIVSQSQLNNGVNNTTNSQRQLNSEARRSTMIVNETNTGINNNVNSQRQLNNEAQRSSGIFSSLKGVIGGLVGIFAVKQGIETLDNMSNIAARLNLINDGSQTQAELQQKIYQAAQESRGEYSLMSATVAKLNMLAKDAFPTNDEAILFAQQMNKQFKISGASLQEQTAATYQLNQAMAAGKLQGDEFRSINENAPMLAQAIAKEMGATQGELKKLGSEGKITAQIIKNALFNTADETNKMFAKIPMTFGDIGNLIKNKMMMSLIPIQQTITNLLNSEGGSQLVNNIGNALTALIAGINILLNAIISIGLFFQNNWGTIQPILYAISAAFILWGMTQIPMLTLKLWLMLEPIIAQAAAWLILNWPILLIGAAIGLLLYAMLNFGDTTVQVIGIVGGIFGVLFGFLFNLFAGFANTVLSVAEFFANVFIDPVYAIQKLFYDMSINVLSFLTNIAKGIENVINMIPGMSTNITSGMTGILDKLNSGRDSLKSEKDVVKLMRFNQVDYGTAFDKGQEIGVKAGQFAVNGLQDISGMIGDKMNSLLNSQENLFGDGKGNSQIGSIKGDVKINAEDIKLLRDVAERDAINKISMLAPNINVSFGDVRETADVDGIATRIKEILAEQISLSAEGAYS